MANIKRRKVRVVSKDYHVDSGTGEVISENIVYAGKYDADLFVKMFLNCAWVLGEVNGNEWKIFCCLAMRMEKDSSVVIVSGETRREISKICGIGSRTMVASLGKLVGLKLLRRLQNGVYEINSDLMFNGNRLKQKQQ